VAAYLSAEFLIGPQLGVNLLNLGLVQETREALNLLGQDLDSLLALEEEPGLGNGGLGRLAACYLESMATLDIPAIGYGIRYEFGIFDQEIRDGWQAEKADTWLRAGNPWEVMRTDVAYPVGFGGRVEAGPDGARRWTPARTVRGVAHDMAITGYGSQIAALLRLWRAHAVRVFDLQSFNAGDYYKAVEEEVSSANLSKVLYPNDENLAGKRLRLEQQYFFVSCSLQDLLRLHGVSGLPLADFHKKYAVQLNDTHPSLGVAELMRLLVDEHGLVWEAAWDVTRQAFHYTNHTLLPEALERWPVSLFGDVLPRHLEIVNEINRRFLAEVRARRPGDEDLVRRVSLIDESGPRAVRMAHLAAVGSRKVNGVAALHTELLKRNVLGDFYSLDPGKFLNVTNGVTPRRWLAWANPPLGKLLTERLGDGWIRSAEQELPRLEPAGEDAAFREAWRAARRANKAILGGLIRERTGVSVDPDALFDVQVKRIHEYKRQHLNVLHILSLYLRWKNNPGFDAPPRLFVFGGKAAPGYFMAKRIIKLIHETARLVNGDPALKDKLRVAFVPDFNVGTAERIYPGADLSEQISTAGKEASGTGNMKFMMNGALTIGTLDGANVEIREAVGAENFFLFGRTVAELDALRPVYRPRETAESRPDLREVLALLASPALTGGDPSLFQPILDSLLTRDEFFLLSDFPSYLDAQARVDAAWRDPEGWTKRSIIQTARSGRFSSDRSIREYAEKIWDIRPLVL
jgi:starch phosphorylase